MRSSTVNGPLRHDQLKNLRDHKYSSSGRSIIEPPFQIFWNWLVEYVPLWLAPNTLTLSGLVINILSVLILVYHSPTGVSEIPALWLCFASISLFVYQTLDALDGKQARRTKTSSPLGELFDHGCDVFSTFFVTLGNCLAVGLGTYPYYLFVQCFYSILLFYMAHWQCYVTGTVRFGMLDVTEAQLSVMILYLISAAFGVEVWSLKLPFVSMELKVMQFYIFMASGSIMAFRFVSIIMKGGSGKNGATVANTSVVSPIIPISIVLFSAITVARKSPSDLYVQYPSLYIITFGMVTSKIINKLVVAHMTKSEITLVDSILLGPLLLILNQYFNCPFQEIYALWICCAYASYDAIKYAVQVCIQIATFLEIYIFRVDKPPSTKSK